MYVCEVLVAMRLRLQFYNCKVLENILVNILNDTDVRVFFKILFTDAFDLKMLHYNCHNFPIFYIGMTHHIHFESYILN